MIPALDAIDYRGSLTLEFFYRADLSEDLYEEDVRASSEFLAGYVDQATDASV